MAVGTWGPGVRRARWIPTCLSILTRARASALTPASGTFAPAARGSARRARSPVARGAELPRAGSRARSSLRRARRVLSPSKGLWGCSSSLGLGNKNKRQTHATLCPPANRLSLSISRYACPVVYLWEYFRTLRGRLQLLQSRSILLRASTLVTSGL